MNVEYIANLIGSSIGIILLILTYTYIDKLERIGCDCAKHPNRDFVKNYCFAGKLAAVNSNQAIMDNIERLHAPAPPKM